MTKFRNPIFRSDFTPSKLSCETRQSRPIRTNSAAQKIRLRRGPIWSHKTPEIGGRSKHFEPILSVMLPEESRARTAAETELTIWFGRLRFDPIPNGKGPLSAQRPLGLTSELSEDS